MAQSRQPTVNWHGSQFVESCGAVLFHLPIKRICVLQLKVSGEFVLPKGRRNWLEPRHVAAVREVTEETGVPCRILDVMIMTRAPPLVEKSTHTPDEPRMDYGSTEPFMMTTRVLGHKNMKVIWWFVAATNQVEGQEVTEPESMYDRYLMWYDEALDWLTWEADREVVVNAMQILEASDVGKASATESRFDIDLDHDEI